MILIDALALYPATELEVCLYQLPNGEEVVVFEDCTDSTPVIYLWALDMANQWLLNRKGNGL